MEISVPILRCIPPIDVANAVDAHHLRHTRIEHHQTHLAAGSFISPFDDAAILSIDGMGDFTSTLTARGSIRGRRSSPVDGHLDVRGRHNGPVSGVALEGRKDTPAVRTALTMPHVCQVGPDECRRPMNYGTPPPLALKVC
jgi:hypothetical protein